MRYMLLVAALLVTGCATRNHYVTEHHDPEIAGRAFGASQRCISAEPNQKFRVADNDRHILLYGSGKTVWATHLDGLCGFSSDDELIAHEWNGQYCSGQLISSLDISRGEGPSCVIGEFTPYTH